MKKEAGVYQNFKTILAPLKLHVHRIENAIQSGTFDLTISRANRTIWVELKRGISEKLRPSQIRWALDRYQAGCTSDMVVVCPNIESGWYIFDVNRVIMNQGELSLFSATSAADNELRTLFLRKLYE